MKVVVRDMHRFYEGQPDMVELGEYESIQLTGVLLRDDNDRTIATHHDDLGWVVPGLNDDEGQPWYWSDITIGP